MLLHAFITAAVRIPPQRGSELRDRGGKHRGCSLVINLAVAYLAWSSLTTQLPMG